MSRARALSTVWGRVVIVAVGTSWRPVRETSYSEPTAAAQRSLNSTSAADTNAGGDGARVVRITYYDNEMNGPLTEDVPLNGTAFVNTVTTNIRFIEKMEVVAAGVARSNQGVITLYGAAGGGGGVIGTIAHPAGSSGGADSSGFPTAGSNRTNWAHHYVATNRIFALDAILGGLVKQQPSEIVLRAHNPLDPLSSPLSDVTPALRLDAPAMSQAIEIPVSIVGPAIVTLWARQDALESSVVHAGFTFSEL